MMNGRRVMCEIEAEGLKSCWLGGLLCGDRSIHATASSHTRLPIHASWLRIISGYMNMLVYSFLYREIIWKMHSGIENVFCIRMCGEAVSSIIME